MIYRIIEGKLRFEDGFIKDPSFRIKSYGQKVYNRVYNSGRWAELMSDRDLFIMMVESKVWSVKEEEQLKKSPSLIEGAKLDYFENFSNAHLKGKSLAKINSLEKDYARLLGKKSQFNNLTIEGVASGAMWHAMICKMYSGTNKLGALAFYQQNFISESDIRDVALSGEWLAISSVSKNPFGRSPINMTDFQRKLCHWTSIYKNVRSHPECPMDEIIEDHNAFDGWMINQNRKDRAEKFSKVQLANVRPDAQNVYLFGNQEQAKDVYSLNDSKGRQKINNLFNNVKKKSNDTK